MYGLGIGFDFDWAFQVYLNLRLRDQVVYLSASSPFLFVFFLETSAFQFWSSPSSLLDSSQSISQSIFSRKPNRLLVLPLRRTSSIWAWKLWSQLQVNSIIVLGCSTITDQAKAKEISSCYFSHAVDDRVINLYKTNHVLFLKHSSAHDSVRRISLCREEDPRRKIRFGQVLKSVLIS